jgi:hypothetical protein
MSAIISACGLYRPRLDREIQDEGLIAATFGVNPSTANATENDQTIRKDMGFGRVLGWRRIIKGNKFSRRATDVRALAGLSLAEAVGPENDFYCEQIMREADVVLFAWGPLSKLPKRLRTRWRVLWEMANDIGKQPLCFGTARDGHPLHTLMLPYSSPLMPWRPAL